MKTQKGVDVPQELADALKTDTSLRGIFERMRPSCQKEYVRWIGSAKKTETRARRVGSALTHIAQWGKQHPAVPVRKYKTAA